MDERREVRGWQPHLPRDGCRRQRTPTPCWPCSPAQRQGGHGQARTTSRYYVLCPSGNKSASELWVSDGTRRAGAGGGDHVQQNRVCLRHATWSPCQCQREAVGLWLCWRAAPLIAWQGAAGLGCRMARATPRSPLPRCPGRPLAHPWPWLLSTPSGVTDRARPMARRPRNSPGPRRRRPRHKTRRDGAPTEPDVGSWTSC